MAKKNFFSMVQNDKGVKAAKRKIAKLNAQKKAATRQYNKAVNAARRKHKKKK